MKPTSRVLRSGTGPKIAAVVVMMAVVTAPGGRFGWAYFFGALRAPDAPVWAPESWPAGDALVWHVIENPTLADQNGLLRAIMNALEAWEDVATADIQWRAEAVVEDLRENAQDGRNTIFIDPDTRVGGYASSFSRRHPELPDAWEVTECDIGLNPRATEDPSSWSDVFIHELGHCLGLGHATLTEPFAPHPVMSYGNSHGIAADDAIGASLLRPAPGWVSRMGAISGRIFFEGEPARFVAVGVIRNEGGAAHRVVDVFTDEQGQFVAQGLPPGEYVLWVHPISSQSAHPGNLARGALLEMEDLMFMHPIEVHAGRETGDLDITVRPGRLR